VAANEQWKVIERARLTRGQFERWFQNRCVRLVVMEACATAHYWARTLGARGIEVRLLPAKYVRLREAQQDRRRGRPGVARGGALG
jgi:transposase